MADLQPTLEQAVAWLKKSLSRQYKVECIQFWRNKFGDKFADQVEAAASDILKK